MTLIFGDITFSGCLFGGRYCADTDYKIGPSDGEVILDEILRQICIFNDSEE